MEDEIRFYTDEHVRSAVVAGLRRREVDVLTTQEAGMVGASDVEHLALAAREKRVLFTQDAHFLCLYASGIPHCGIVYAHQRTRIGDVIRGLLLIHGVLRPKEIANQVEFL